MRASLIAVLANLLLASLAFSQSLPVRMRRAIENELVPAYSNGDYVAVLQYASSIAENVQANRWPAIDDELHRHELPDLGTLFVQSRLELQRMNHRGRLPAPSPREMELILPALERNVAATVQSATASQFMATEQAAGRGFTEYEAMLWDAHVAKNQLLNVAALVGQAEELAKTKRGTTRNAKAEQSPAERLARLAQSARETQRQIDERTIELRIERLEHARSVLKQNADLADRFKAAWVADLDGDLLEGFLRDAAESAAFVREALRKPGLADEIKTTTSEVRELAGQALMCKSRLFHTGLHWWLRGRYGRGPAGNGFLKSPRAMKSPQAMFGLYMPVKIPTPTSPGEAYQIPEIDRRHHYGWMFEYRRAWKTITPIIHQSKQTPVRSVDSVTTLSRFY